MKTLKEIIPLGAIQTKLTRSVEETIAPLVSIVETSVSLISKPLPAFRCNGIEYSIPRFLFVGPKGGTEPFRVALFGAVHGNEP
jgi:protein MpaA